MAKAGALLVGVNCLFDPFICLEVLKTMKVALDAFELTPYLMAQPLATGCQTEAALGGLRSLSFLSAWNPGRSRVGKLESGLARLLSLVCATLEAVVDLNHTTSGPWLRS